MILMGRSVTGISHIDYILPIAAYARGRNQISESEILQIVRKEAVKREKQKALFAGKFWIDYEKKLRSEKRFLKGITNSLILAMRKWQLIKDTDMKGLFRIGEPLVDLSKLDTTTNNGSRHAKLLLYNSVLQSGKESLFNPSSFLISIRDNAVSKIHALCSTNGGRITKELEIPYVEGRAYNDHYFVYTKLGTNFRSFDIMRDWGYLFGFLNDYDTISTAVEKGEKILYPKYEVYLTKVVSSLHEKIQVLKHLHSLNTPLAVDDFQNILGMNKYAVVCVIHNLKFLDLVSYEKERAFLDERARNTISGMQRNTELLSFLCKEIIRKGALLVSDDPRRRGVLANFNDLDPEHAFMFADPSWEMSDFEKALKEAYVSLTGGKTYRYTWIPILRQKVCRKLRIHNDTFDSLLSLLFEQKPEMIEFSKAAGDVTRRMLRRFKKPFKLRGRTYRMIIVGGT